MNRPIPLTFSRGLVVACCLSTSFTIHAQDSMKESDHGSQEASMTQHASGEFDVKLDPRPPAEGEIATIARMALDKQFHGDLDATSQGQMLAFRTPLDGSAGYVAMEQVSGTLQGRRGTFVLQHSGIMNRGEPSLNLVVVPDSGTDELEGLSGSMEIILEEGKHFYEFDYELP